MTETTFTELGVDDDLVATLAEDDIVHAFPIQELTISLGLSGADVIGQARTGTGKTLAFGLPVLQKIEPGKGPVQALVVAPTRELASQVASDLEGAGRPRDISVLAVYGGVAIGPQTDTLKAGKADIVVGTPGRLLDHLGRGNLSLSDAKILVLDEADRMLDMGFLPDVERLITACESRRQTLLFSATMPSAVVALARRYMDHPTFIQAEAEGPDVPPETDQHFFLVHRMDKPRILARLLQAPNVKLATVFVRTKRMADRLVRELDDLGVNATPIHGDLRQQHREKNLKKFRHGKAAVLVATEVAARGLDIDDVTHVVNYDCPDDEHMYLHRVGRTGRAGAAGVAVTFATHNEVGRVNVIRRAVDLADEPLPEIFSTSDLLAERFDLPDRTPWGHLGGTGDSGSSNGSHNGSKKRDTGKGQDDKSDGKSGKDSGKKPSRSRSHDRKSGRDSGKGSGKGSKGRSGTRSSTDRDDAPARTRTRTRDVSTSKDDEEATTRTRTRPDAKKDNKQDNERDREHRTSRRGPAKRDDAPQAPAPAASASPRETGRPSLRRRVKVEHLP